MEYISLRVSKASIRSRIPSQSHSDRVTGALPKVVLSIALLPQQCCVAEQRNNGDSFRIEVDEWRKLLEPVPRVLDKGDKPCGSRVVAGSIAAKDKLRQLGTPHNLHGKPARNIGRIRPRRILTSGSP